MAGRKKKDQKSKLHTISVRLELGQLKFVEAMARVLGIKRSEVIRDIIKKEEESK